MEIRLLKKGYQNNDQFYQDFLNNQIESKDEYFSGEVVHIDEAPDFPIYINTKDKEKRQQLFFEAFETLAQSYLNTDRDIHFEATFWHSLLSVYKRDYLLEQYPEIAEKQSDFNNIVLKKFDWENYIYKCILGAQYVNDFTQEEEARKRYYRLIVENLDLFNYMIKYEIFRNDQFVLNILDIIDRHSLGKVMKAKIKDRPDLGADERVGRRVIFEFNKSYPVVMSPMLEREELEELFFEYLAYYYDVQNVKA